MRQMHPPVSANLRVGNCRAHSRIEPCRLVGAESTSLFSIEVPAFTITRKSADCVFRFKMSAFYDANFSLLKLSRNEQRIHGDVAF
jgi:hypothetical protein